MDGWIKLHRKMLGSRAWCDADAEGKVILLTLLLSACHTNTVWKIKRSGIDTVLKPGELYISLRAFAKKCGVSFNKINFEFKRLKSIGFLNCKSSNSGTLVQILNWGKYQLADTVISTPAETPLEPENVDGDCNIASVLLPLETPLETHNKKYSELINKYNKNKVQEAVLSPEFINAIQDYNTAFPNAPLSVTDMQMLQEVALTASVSWVAMAVSELITKQREMVVRKPQKYLKGVLKNWLKDGVPYVEKSESAALEDFYKHEGVE